MKPFKNGKFLAQWIMRIALVLYILMHYWPAFRTLNFADSEVILSALLIIFSLLLLVGGFITKQSLTVLSALFIFLISVYLVIVRVSAGFNGALISSLMITSMAFYFFTSGNKG
ncbi:MAG TPA: hypothetical protein VE912_11295 [Bacteroidales bacterium]|nr:hypothetical protein [Bacteroidales bacterium]